MRYFFMLSSVYVSGVLKEVKSDGFCILEVEASDVLKEKYYSFDLPLCHWTRSQDNVLTGISIGKTVLVKGRIEYSESKGVYILAEVLHCLN